MDEPKNRENQRKNPESRGPGTREENRGDWTENQGGNQRKKPRKTEQSKKKIIIQSQERKHRERGNRGKNREARRNTKRNNTQSRGEKGQHTHRQGLIVPAIVLSLQKQKNKDNNRYPQ